jgi:DNA-binding SARP family transcriptional activator/tetratricopeptide (TPR) repeat protein
MNMESTPGPQNGRSAAGTGHGNERKCAPAAGLEFGVLGPLLVRRDGEMVPISAGRQHALLATLLLNAERTVSADVLIETLWDGDPPVSARASLHNYVRRLRKALPDRDRSRILTRPPGYAIRVDPGELDLIRFEVQLGAARDAAVAGSWQEAAAQARAALSLWRGDPLEDVESQALALREVPVLTEKRLQALETRLDADLHLGGHADVTAELRRLAAVHPLREHLHALLMLALYRCGRPAEALAAYRDARRMLIGELGTEPGTELRELHQRILHADPVLSLPEAAPPTAASPVPEVPRELPAVPRELPAMVRHFAGREDELAELTGLADIAGGQAPGAVLISAIGGTPGVGKTALALHWAHQVADRFPDGQLYVNLRGYDPGPPMAADHALARFLRVLGMPSRDIPADEDERSARYRSLLAGRRVLVLLDNAGSVEQVRPLLPATAGCMALVTSRDSLAGLVARDGARRLDLDLLPLADAEDLLRSLIGGRAAADPAATRTLARLCGRLPLALRVAAERAVARPGTPLTVLAAELTGERGRLDLLDAGRDPRTAVRSVFSWSYRQLEPAAARTFRLLSLHPGPDFGIAAVGALTSVSFEQAGDVLESLARAHLVQPAGAGHYGMHDLLRGYARELAAADDAGDERPALTRLFGYYLDTAAAAMDALFPAERHRRPRLVHPAAAVPPVADPAEARTWLETERGRLADITAYAAVEGWPAHAVQLAATLSRYLDAGGHYSEAVTVHRHARDAAHRMDDGAAEAQALTSLSIVDAHQGRYQQASLNLQQALSLFRGAANPAGEARALIASGFVDFKQGGYQQAARHFSRARVLYCENADLTGEALALGNLGDANLLQGRYERAADHYRQSLSICRQTGDQYSEALALNGLGDAFIAAGRPAEACVKHSHALSIASQIGDKSEQARAHHGLGRAHRALGEPGQARHHWRQAVALYTHLGAPEAGQIRAQLTTGDDRDHHELHT